MSGWSEGPNSYIYRLSAPRASRDQSDVFIEKGELFDERIGLATSKPTLAAVCYFLRVGMEDSRLKKSILT
jgi:hypothetical protein